MAAFAIAQAIVVAAAALALERRWLESRTGRLLLGAACVVFPAGAVLAGISHNMRAAQRTAFCGSCHEMDPYIESLQLDDDELVPAHHFQDGLVARDRACYVCHQDYALFGDLSTKLKGLRHLWVHYAGEVPATIELYRPYPNANCLSCHREARSFAESAQHAAAGVTLEALDSGRISCLAAGCHDLAHAVARPDSAELRGARR